MTRILKSRKDQQLFRVFRYAEHLLKSKGIPWDLSSEVWPTRWPALLKSLGTEMRRLGGC